MPLAQTAPTIGDRAPDFTLPTESGKSVTLSDFQGKKNIVLIFYPGDLTPGCTMQLCSIRDEWSKFQKADTLVFGVNHGDAESHRSFSKKYGFPFPLLVDKGKKVSAKYGAVLSFLRHSLIRRTVVVIDRHGNIAYVKRGMPKNADILKSLQ